MSEIERIYQRGYEQGKSNAYSVILSTLKRVWEKYEADKENVPKPSFTNAITLIELLKDGDN